MLHAVHMIALCLAGWLQVTAAEADGVHVVLPAWLQACKHGWRRAEEGPYVTPAAGGGGGGGGGAPGHQPFVTYSETEELAKVLAAAGGGAGTEPGQGSRGGAG